MAKSVGFVVAGALAAVAAVGTARADTLGALTYPYGNQIVTLEYTGTLPPAGTFNNPNGVSAYAGEVNIVDGPGSINAFCTDIFNDWSPNGTYTQAQISSATLNLSSNGNSNANNGHFTTGQFTSLVELLNGVNATNYIAGAGNSTAQSVASAAVQVAIWEIENEMGTGSVTPYNLTTGVFQITNNAPVATAANGLLGGLGSGAWNNGNGVLTEFISNPAGDQDFTLISVTQNSLTQVPEPGSLVLLGTAVVGFGALSRRRRARPAENI